MDGDAKHDHAAAPAPSLEELRFAFDLQGFVVLRGVLSPAEVAACNAAIDANKHRYHERKGGLRNSKRDAFAGDGSTGRFDCGGFLTWPKPHCEPFRALLCHARLVGLLNTVLGEGFRLDHLPLSILQPPGGEGFDFHGGRVDADGQWQDAVAYDCHHGKIRAALVNVAFALTQTKEGDGGFAIIPGSHKANFPLPSSIASLSSSLASTPLVHCPSLSPGDCVVFAEATTHGALPWTGATERRTLFYRYAPFNRAYGRGYTLGEGGAFGTLGRDVVDELTPSQRAVLQPPFHTRLDRESVAGGEGANEVEVRVLQPRSGEKRAFDEAVYGHPYF